MSSDPTPFKAPERYPDPPKDMYYQVPKTPTYQKPAPIFPWERDAPKPTRVFAEDNITVTEAPPKLESSDSAAASPATLEVEKSAPVTPTTPTFQATPADPWQTYTRGNAWDDIPEIERYIGNLQKNRKGNIQVLQGYGSGIDQVSSPGARRHSMKLTDFPTELERPSLPVTPAPIRRPAFWGKERDEEGELPAAEGVPSQEDWVSLFDDYRGLFDEFKRLFDDPKSLSGGPTSLFYDLKGLLKHFQRLFNDLKRYSLTPRQDPAAQLEMLARRQSDVLARKLGESPTREIPTRPLPYGSEGVISPTYVARTPPRTGTQAEATPRLQIEEPSYHGPGAMWEKDETFPSQQTPLGASEEEKDVLET